MAVEQQTTADANTMASSTAMARSNSPSTLPPSATPLGEEAPPPPVNRPPSNTPPPPPASPIMADMFEELPSNVNTEAQLKLLPAECLSGNKERPLLHVDESGNYLQFSLRPMIYSVWFILLIELLERFSFYGINYTQTSFLTGAYDQNWNAGMEAVPASTYVSISTAVAYTTPFWGAYLADVLIGDYWSMFVGSLVFYLPGLLLIALTTIPYALGEEFNRTALATGLLFLWPVGTGIVKSIVNVFGARQFHPILQSSFTESYYVSFYMCINIGALVGGVVVPLTAQQDVTVAYFIPVGILALGVTLFSFGTSRYVRTGPKGDLFSKEVSDMNNEPSIDLGAILRISVLVIPFCIAYSQMATTFIVQGTVMSKAFGFIDAACMNNADAVAVLFFGYLIGSILYPWLNDIGVKIPTTYKFAIGSALGALAIAWALLVELWIHEAYEKNGEKISILWQTMSYVLIGAGEIFAVSSAYEAAFSASPPEKKVLASAINLFCIGSIPNVICIGLYNACEGWFRNSRGTTQITHLHDYASANVDKYFLLLFGISLFGVFLNLLPSVRSFVEDIEDKASVLIRTPKTPMRPPTRKRAEAERDIESSPLLRAQRHQAYLKYGSGPQLYRSGSMRAGPPMSKQKLKDRHIKKNAIRKLYQSERGLSTPRETSAPSHIPGGGLLIPPRQGGRDGAELYRSNSLDEVPKMQRTLSG